jgi:predicted MFS family arabinose efflux permease
MAERLIPLIGFGWTVRVIGFVYLFLLIVAMMTVKSRLEHARTPFNVLDFFRPFKLRPVYLTALASFFFFLGVFVPYDFLIVQARYEGMSHNMAINLLAILNATR